MTAHPPPIPADLYERDETAWLDLMADLAAAGAIGRLDLGHLAEYLRDMAKRDRWDVTSRLERLVGHLLKWQFQPGHRGTSWRQTIRHQRQALNDTFADSRVLSNHAVERFPLVYRRAVADAADETGLPPPTFPADCPYTLEQVLDEGWLPDGGI